MKSIKTFFRKYWPLIGLIISVILDSSTGLVEHLVKDPFYEKMVYLFGAILYGYFFKSKLNQVLAEKQINNDKP